MRPKGINWAEIAPKYDALGRGNTAGKQALADEYGIDRHCQVNGQGGRTGWLSGTLRSFRGHFVSPSGTLEPQNQPK
jgi:hypothetical protein